MEHLGDYMKKPLLLVIMDGYGIGGEKNNAVLAAKTPSLDRLFETCPHTLIAASGLDVGLPEGQMGNSEVGHTNIGAGRIVYQELTRITKEIKDGPFFSNRAFKSAIENCRKNASALHLFGLLSDGGVHSHNTHLYALLQLAKDAGLTKVYVHALLDGRDVPPSSGIEFVNELERKIKEIGVGKIATVMGRYYAMDRDNRWERVELAYNAIALAKGEQAEDAADAVLASYSNKITDEFMLPTVIGGGAPISEGDSMICFNFRPDRAREITRTFVDDAFSGFEREKGRIPVFYVCMTQFDATMPNVEVAFSPQSLANTFGEYISEHGLTQLRIAETEKYAHVTFFFNGGVEKVAKGEDRNLIASPKVATYDLQPEMSAPEVTKEALAKISSGAYDVIILNYANCDMVGHTGFFDAAVKAVEAVDKGVGEITAAVAAMGGISLITADHGNAELMAEEDGTPYTAHTTNPVPFIVVGLPEAKLREGGRLADIAPTMLKLLELPVPAEMDGESLIVN